jgi:Protein of unknown function (DUF3352)
MPRLLLTLAVLTTSIVVAAGCGNDRSSASDAASLVPAGAVVYGEATLRPEGDQKAAIDALVAKFPGEGSAGERISRLLEKSLAESDPELSWKRDFEPWIGDEAAFFVSGVRPNGGDADVAALVATEDEDATVATLEKDEGGKKTDYRGRDLYVFPEQDSAGAAVDGWLVLGNPGGVKAAIDVAEGGDPIDEDDSYQRTLEDAPEERLGFVYVNGRAFAERLDESPAGAALGQFRRLLAEPVLATLHADESGFRFEATVPESYLASFPFIAEGSDLAAALPADAWLAMAQPELGKTIDAYIDLVADTVGGRDVIAQQFRAATGLDLEDDLISWMGDWGLFVRGTSVAELDGAMVIETSDEAASGRLIDAVARLARRTGDVRVGPLELAGGGEGVTVRSPDVPRPVHLFQRDGKVVVAYGDAAANDALSPRETLGDSASFTAAEDALGEDYPLAFYLAIEPILELVDSTEAASDPDWQEAKPYLEPLEAIVAGARKDGDKLRSVFGVTVE